MRDTYRLMRDELPKGFRVALILVLALSLALGGLMLQAPISESPIGKLFTTTIYVGMQGQAYAYTSDYEADGVNDHIEVQQAVDALPASGGRVVLLGGSYNFGAVVTRAIGNVTIEGMGPGTYTARDGVNVLFTVGGQDWVFINFATDAGGLGVGAQTWGVTAFRYGIWIGGTYTSDLLLNVVEDTSPTLGGNLDANGQTITALLSLDYSDFSELTINAGGVITVTQTCHTVDTFANGATDDLDTINGGTNGMTAILRAEDGARTVVLRHNVGNIWLQGKSNISLDDLEDGIQLIYDGAMWFDIGISEVGTGGGNGSFGAVDTPLGTSIIANSSNDTIIFTSDGNILITGGGVADTVDLALAGNVTFSSDLGYFGNVTGTSGYAIASGNDTLNFTSDDGTMSITVWAGNDTADFSVIGGGGAGNFWGNITAPDSTWVIANGNDTLFLLGDGNVTITANQAADSITLGISNNVVVQSGLGYFGNITTTSGEPVIASGNDTLFLEAGAGIVITGSAGNDSIIISTTAVGDITAVGNVTSGPAFTGGDSGNRFWFEGNTTDGFEIELRGEDVGADYQLTIPGATGYLVVDTTKTTSIDGNSLTITLGTLNVDDDFLLNTGDVGTGNYNFSAALYLTQFPLYFEGATTDNTWTRFGFVDPTANNTITFPDDNGTVVLTNDLGYFGVINPLSGTNPVASGNDTLNFTSTGPTLTIVGTAGTDTIDFAVIDDAHAHTQTTLTTDYFGNITAPSGNVIANGNDTVVFTSDDGTVVISAWYGNDTIDFSVPGGGGGGGNFWGNITAPYGTSLIANGNDTLIFLSDSGNLTITGDYAADTITFDWSANLNDLDDVSVTNDTGDMIYGNGTHWIDLLIGNAGQQLLVSGGTPAWINPGYFGTVNAPNGTDPVASGNDTLNLASSDSSISITGNYATDTIDLLAAVKAAFGVIDAAQGTDPIANAANDTLVLAEGEGIDVTGDYATDTITIAGEDASTTNKGIVVIDGNGYLDITSGNLTHEPVRRYFPEVFGCSLTANSTSPFIACADVTFDAFTLSVVEFEAGDIGNLHLRVPADYGYGGNTSVDVSFGWRVVDGTTGSVTWATRAGSSIDNVKADAWITSAADSWVQNDDIHWTDYRVIPPNGISSGEQDLYLQFKLDAETCDATNIYLDKITVKGWGV